jgi:hypothetical protein
MASSIGNGMANPAGGLAINQLVKMRCAGQITMEQFLELTAGVDGFAKDDPVVLCDADADEPVAPTAAKTVAEVEEDEVEAVQEKGVVEDEADVEVPLPKKPRLGGMDAFLTRAPPSAAAPRKVPIPKAPTAAERVAPTAGQANAAVEKEAVVEEEAAVDEEVGEELPHGMYSHEDQTRDLPFPLAPLHRRTSLLPQGHDFDPRR